MHILFVGPAKSTVCDEQNTTNKAPSALRTSSELDKVNQTSLKSPHSPMHMPNQNGWRKERAV